MFCSSYPQGLGALIRKVLELGLPFVRAFTHSSFKKPQAPYIRRKSHERHP
jgi:hypothetical protein